MITNPQINILLIEDNEDDVFFIKKALDDDKYAIKIIHSGAEAFKYLKNPELIPDIVLLDKNLPEMNGLELLENLKNQGLQYSIIFLTVDNNVNTVIQAMKAGAMDFIIKSTKLKTELPEKIEKVFNIHLDKIEKKSLEEDLKESEYRFRSMFTNSPIAYQALDEKGNYTDVNNGLCNLLGYTNDEFIGRSFGKFWYYKDERNFPRAFEKFKREGYTNVEIDLRHKNGHKVSVVLEGKVQKGTSGTFIKAHCILHNITERKLMEKTLSHQFDFQRLVSAISSVFLGINDASWENKIDSALQKIGEFYEADRCYLFRFSYKKPENVLVNHEWCAKNISSRVKDFSLTPWENHAWLFSTVEQGNPVNISSIDNLPKEAESDKIEFKKHKTQSLTILPIMKQGKAIGFLGIDWVSKKKQLTKTALIELSVLEKVITSAVFRHDAEKALKESELRYKTVADYTFNWEYWLGDDGDVRYMSPAVRTITGYEAADFIRNKNLLDDIVFKNDILKWQKHNEEIERCVLIDTRASAVEFRIIRKDGKIRWIRHLCRKIVTDNGLLIGSRVSNMDISNIVDAEKKLLNIATEVEEKERSRFSKELHDGLGPLLSSVKLYFQWLADTDDPDKTTVIIEKGNNSIDMAIQTTREISHNLNPEFLSIFGLVETLSVFIGNINETGKLNISFSYNKNVRFEDIKERVLYNSVCELINNTIRHASAKNVFVELKVDENNGKVNLKYSDDGKGFVVEDAIDIYKTKGIGLYNINQKIATLRGFINIESEPGKGMSANIEL